MGAVFAAYAGVRGNSVLFAKTDAPWLERGGVGDAVVAGAII